MKTQPRWITKTIAEAEACKTRMPWERGLRRQAFIAKRLEAEDRRTKITLAPTPDWMNETLSA